MVTGGACALPFLARQHISRFEDHKALSALGFNCCSPLLSCPELEHGTDVLQT